jgi:transcriptional regulator with XRE-family HTH domain
MAQDTAPSCQLLDERALAEVSLGMTKIDVTKSLRPARLAQGMSQQELANRLGVAQSSISKIESRGNDARLSTAQRYVEALGGRLVAHITWPEGTVSECPIDHDGMQFPNDELGLHRATRAPRSLGRRPKA